MKSEVAKHHPKKVPFLHITLIVFNGVEDVVQFLDPAAVGLALLVQCVAVGAGGKLS